MSLVEVSRTRQPKVVYCVVDMDTGENVCEEFGHNGHSLPWFPIHSHNTSRYTVGSFVGLLR